jgi:hypothetical protein
MEASIFFFCQYSWSMRLFINNTWLVHDGAPSHFLRTVKQNCTRLSVNSGHEAVASTTDLHDPMTLIICIFWLWAHAKMLVHSAPINDFEVLQ